MFSAMFGRPITFTDESVLRETFGSNRLFLASDSTVTFEGAITLGPEVAFKGACQIGAETVIDQGAILTDVVLATKNRVRAYSVLSDISAGNGNLFGPFCFLRDGCVIADHSILGAYVEATRSRFGFGVKVSHRAFVGDAEIGDESIIGAGVVFCNYDGLGRQPTRVGARVVLGSGTLLIPPLTVGDDAFVAAGSIINRDVPSGMKVIQKRPIAQES